MKATWHPSVDLLVTPKKMSQTERTFVLWVNPDNMALSLFERDVAILSDIDPIGRWLMAADEVQKAIKDYCGLEIDDRHQLARLIKALVEAVPEPL